MSKNNILFDPNKDYVYQLFVEYFGNPYLTKTKDVHQFSVYMAKVKAMLGIEYKYLIVFVRKDDKAMNSTEKLSELYWVSLQTRLMEEEHDIVEFSYYPRRMAGLDKKITLKKNNNQYTYDVEELPITITLLPKKKKGNEVFSYNEYASEGSVVVAIETFQTIVSML